MVVARLWNSTLQSCAEIVVLTKDKRCDATLTQEVQFTGQHCFTCPLQTFAAEALKRLSQPVGRGPRCHMLMQTHHKCNVIYTYIHIIIYIYIHCALQTTLKKHYILTIRGLLKPGGPINNFLFSRRPIPLFFGGHA